MTSDTPAAPCAERPSVRRTVPYFSECKGVAARRIVALTAYDFTIARRIDATGQVDMILVGDSAACVVQGHTNTLPITLDEICYHSRCVSRGVQYALVVGDLPFLSYQSSIERAIESAGKLLKEGGAAAVKLEGGLTMARTIEALVAVDIPVVGHVGLTPQSYHRMGGHRIQGKREGTMRGTVPMAGTRERVLADARAVEAAGAFAVVVEGIPHDLAAEITEALSIPTIGIGAGPHCNGQILVSYDMLGCNPDFTPSFLKHFANLGSEIDRAVRTYAHEVRSGEFPVEALPLPSNAERVLSGQAEIPPEVYTLSPDGAAPEPWSKRSKVTPLSIRSA